MMVLNNKILKLENLGNGKFILKYKGYKGEKAEIIGLSGAIGVVAGFVESTYGYSANRFIKEAKNER